MGIFLSSWFSFYFWWKTVVTDNFDTHCLAGLWWAGRRETFVQLAQ